jgi:hypothetical protein
MAALSPVATILASGVLSAVTGWFSSRVNVTTQLALSARKFRAAIAAELRVLHSRLLLFEDIFTARVTPGKLECAQVVAALFQDHDMAVFLDNASAVGLLDGRTGLQIIRFYADLRSLKTRGGLLNEIAESNLRPLDEEQRLYLAYIRRVRRRAHRLMTRLRAARPSRLGAFLGR